jgi:prepilin-type N-terminal cleavage/methylation domain-containing protein
VRRRRGFTLVEVMIVATIIAILTRIALPKYRQVRTRARAAAIISELNVVRGAAYQSFENRGVWPADAATGKIPTHLTTLLPGSLSFQPEKAVSYDWRLTGMPGGNPSKATTSATMGMGVSTSDLILRAEVQRQLAAHPTLVTGGIVYWLIWGPTVKP